MTDTAARLDAGPAGDAATDPFVRQLTWLVDRAGGKEALVRATANRVSARTLDNWVRGDYPRATVTGAVRDLDKWALAAGIDYPEAAGAPRLVDTCGPATAPRPEPAVSVPAAPRGRLGLLLAAVALVVVTAAISVGVTLVVVDAGPATATGGGTGTTGESAPTDLPALPVTGDGTLYPELTGSLGSNTFADPRTLADNSAPIPADTTVDVVCRYYSPIIASVTPDGFWYLIDSEEWSGRWAPANTFMNGDTPGGPYVHNTDFAVPVCS